MRRPSASISVYVEPQGVVVIGEQVVPVVGDGDPLAARSIGP